MEPSPAVPDAPFLLSFEPQVDPPVNVVQTKLVLRGVTGVDLSLASLDALVSSRGLPRVLQAGGQIGDGPGQLSLLLDGPPTRGVTAEAIFRLDIAGLGGTTSGTRMDDDIHVGFDTDIHINLDTRTVSLMYTGMF